MDRNPRARDGVSQRLTLDLLAVGRRFKAIYRVAAADGVTKEDLRRVHGALWGASIDEKPDPAPGRRRRAIEFLLPDLEPSVVLPHLADYRAARARWEKLQRERTRS